MNKKIGKYFETFALSKDKTIFPVSIYNSHLFINTLNTEFTLLSCFLKTVSIRED